MLRQNRQLLETLLKLPMIEQYLCQELQWRLFLVERGLQTA